MILFGISIFWKLLHYCASISVCHSALENIITFTATVQGAEGTWKPWNLFSKWKVEACYMAMVMVIRINATMPKPEP